MSPGPSLSGPHARERLLVGVLLACALLLAQALLAAHAVEHLGHPDDEPCEICLAAAPLAPAFTSFPSPLICTGQPLPRPLAHPTPAFRATFNPQRPRAPPQSQQT